MAKRKQPMFRSMELNPHNLPYYLEVNEQVGSWYNAERNVLHHVFVAMYDIAWDYDFPPRTEPGKEWYNPDWFMMDDEALAGTGPLKLWFARVEDFDLAVLILEVLKTEGYGSDTIEDILVASNEIEDDNRLRYYLLKKLHSNVEAFYC